MNSQRTESGNTYQASNHLAEEKSQPEKDVQMVRATKKWTDNIYLCDLVVCACTLLIALPFYIIYVMASMAGKLDSREREQPYIMFILATSFVTGGAMLAVWVIGDIVRGISYLFYTGDKDVVFAFVGKKQPKDR